MTRSTAIIPAALACAATTTLLVLAGGPGSGAGKQGVADPAKAFSALFQPVENAMGIKIKTGKMKLNLLSGDVSVGNMALTHPQQGKFATATGIRFPFGALIGASDPMKASTAIDKVTVRVDFEGERFWKVAPPGGGPIPGAPSLELGKLAIGSGDLHLSSGKDASVSLTGFSADIRKLKVPGKIWSKGEVPQGRWVEVSVNGGTFKMDGHPYVVALESASFQFTSTTFSINKLEGTLTGGGRVSMEGSVGMKGGKPSAYDILLDLENVRIDKPSLDAIASGRLSLSGAPGKLKLDGKLKLTKVAALRAAKWSQKPCTGNIKLTVALEPDGGSKFKKAKLKGTSCQGRITLK